jgi:enamine deaminase RidA (YjgF/YER057c/UK114 family)
MEREVTGPHRAINPPSLARPSGFSHAVVAAPGRTVYLAGQTPSGSDGAIRGATIVEQFDAAARNLLVALQAAGGAPEHLVSMQIFTTDLAAYRSELQAIGAAYRRHFGRHYPAMALLEVSALFAPGALIEIQAIAVIPV